MGELAQFKGELTKKELLEILRNPTWENKARLRDLILSNLKRVNELDENDPDFLELVGKMYQQNDLLKEVTQEDEDDLAKIADLIEQNAEVAEEDPFDISQMDPLNPPNLASFDRTSKPYEVNEQLLDLLKSHKLENLGITRGFKIALRDFTKKQKRKREITRNEDLAIKEMMKKGGRLEQGFLDLHLEDSYNGYFPSTSNMVNRTSQSTALAEQLAINEVNLVERRKRDARWKHANQYEPRGVLVKQKVYRVTPDRQVISREEHVLTNGGKFNIIEKPTETSEQQKNDILRG